MGGVILGSQVFIDKHIHSYLRQTGPAMSPFNAWVLLKALETLPLRVRRQTETAAIVANSFAEHARVVRLVYPGRPDHPQAELVGRQMTAGSSLLALEVAGGKAGAFRFMNALKIFQISNNLGDAKSLVTHPATTTHERYAPDVRAAMGVTEGLVRLSIGLEHPNDLKRDLDQALGTV
jgi:O-succinylhomoserine sulfhydrylase